MKINILIPSKNNSKKLLFNIEKNKFIESIKLQYLVLVDTLQEEIEYKEKLSHFQNVIIIRKRLNYQSDRYSLLLNYKDADLYLISSDDVFFELNEQIVCNLSLPLVLNCSNEKNLIANHPLITDEFKHKVVKIFNEYRFSILCIDSLICFLVNKQDRITINMKSNHDNFKIYISKFTYNLYVKDLYTFLKFTLSKFFTYGNFIRNTSFLYSISINLLSAIKNYIFKKD